MSTTNETNHTPGPWTYFTHFLEDGTRAIDDSDEPRMRFILGADRQGLAHTVGLSGGRDAANARLIAAAPAMFASLTHLLREVTGDPQALACVDLRHIEAARTALAQARGAT